jgi:hypothetical protein
MRYAAIFILNEDKPLTKSGRENYIEVDGTIDDLKYHSDWNWLMEVVEKISATVIKGTPPFNGDQFARIEIIPNGYVKIENLRDTPIFKNVWVESGLINATWLACVDFIKWYNEQSKTK